MSVLDQWRKPAAEKADPATSAPLPEQDPATSATNVANCTKRIATSNPLTLQDGFGVVAESQMSQGVLAGARERESESDPSEEGQVISPARWAGACDGPSFEEPCPERRGLVERQGSLFLHFCVECGRWGAYGFGTTLSHPGRWYCRLHRPA
jgi:hypothetical protein